MAKEFRSLATIFRILGNEMPPRDTVGSRLEVLEYILKNEPQFQNVEKWYLINRLQNIQFRRSVCELLDRYNAKYVTVLLNRKYVLDAGLGRTTEECGSTLEIRREKIRRAIEINGARNMAIERGQRYSKYVVVLDGDCMFDAAGWDVVQEEMLLGTSQHLSIPMVRSRIGALNEPGHKLEEPQVAFRHDSRVRFDNTIPFGESDKLRLLYDLGHDQIPGGGHCSVVGDATKIVGRVHHLSTGEDDTETDNALRCKLRSESLDKLLSRISTEMPN